MQIAIKALLGYSLFSVPPKSSRDASKPFASVKYIFPSCSSGGFFRAMSLIDEQHGIGETMGSALLHNWDNLLALASWWKVRRIWCQRRNKVDSGGFIVSERVVPHVPRLGISGGGAEQKDVSLFPIGHVTGQLITFRLSSSITR